MEINLVNLLNDVKFNHLIKKFKCSLSKENFLDIFNYANCPLKKDIDKLYNLIKSFAEKSNKINKKKIIKIAYKLAKVLINEDISKDMIIHFFKDIDFNNDIIKNIIKKITKKNVLNNECKMRKIQNKVIKFFNNIKNDPEFIRLDKEFLSLENEDNYNNFIEYFNIKYKELEIELNLPFFNVQIIQVMSDNYIPMFNSFHPNKNTFENYSKGDIEFISLNSYIISIKTLRQNKDISYLDSNEYIYSSKLGVAGEFVVFFAIFLVILLFIGIIINIVEASGGDI